MPKSYKVLKAFAGLKEGTEIVEECNGSFLVGEVGDNKLRLNNIWNGIEFALLLHCGFIEETGKIAQEVGGENEITCLMPDGSPLFSHRNKFCKHFSPYLHPAPQNEWRPKKKSTYWYISAELSAYRTDNIGSEFNDISFSTGNCFKTKESCERATEEIKKLLKGLAKE